MKNLKIKHAVLFIPLLISISNAHADDWTGNVSGYLGAKSLDSDDWKDLDSQFSIGVIADFKQKNWPVSIATDFIGSADVHETGNQEDTGYTLETHLGIRKVFAINNTSIKPYVGGGLAIVAAGIEKEVSKTTTKDDDNTFGTWAGAGAYMELTPDFTIGFDIRYSKAEATIFDIEREVGGLHTGITAGYHW